MFKPKSYLFRKITGFFCCFVFQTIFVLHFHCCHWFTESRNISERRQEKFQVKTVCKNVCHGHRHRLHFLIRTVSRPFSFTYLCFVSPGDIKSSITGYVLMFTAETFQLTLFFKEGSWETRWVYGLFYSPLFCCCCSADWRFVGWSERRSQDSP